MLYGADNFCLYLSLEILLEVEIARLAIKVLLTTMRTDGSPTTRLGAIVATAVLEFIRGAAEEAAGVAH